MGAPSSPAPASGATRPCCPSRTRPIGSAWVKVRRHYSSVPAWPPGDTEAGQPQPAGGHTLTLPSFEQVSTDKLQFADATRIIHNGDANVLIVPPATAREQAGAMREAVEQEMPAG